ncbi:MAG: hypothetical protein CXX71_03895 [Methanobacteriota archaeon]|nr:MAG: hypothetical protein CXX71_03895 [Euryarchaeota archaeon]
MDASLDGIRCVMLDLDGTCYLTSLSGEVTLIDGVLDFLQRCDERGIARFFLSNNSSRSVEEYVSKLAGVGISATQEDVMLSTHDAISWLKEQGATRVHLMGTDGCHSMLQDGGIGTRSDDPQFVVIGYHNALSYCRGGCVDAEGNSLHGNTWRHELSQYRWIRTSRCRLIFIDVRVGNRCHASEGVWQATPVHD